MTCMDLDENPFNTILEGNVYLQTYYYFFHFHDDKSSVTVNP